MRSTASCLSGKQNQVVGRYLFQSVEDLSKLRLNTERRFHSPPMDPVISAPGRWTVASRKMENGNISPVLRLNTEEFSKCSKSKNFTHLALHFSKTFRSMVKSLQLPASEEICLCFCSASFCVSGWPVGKKNSYHAWSHWAWTLYAHSTCIKSTV